MNDKPGEKGRKIRKIYFVGAGPGATDLITLRGRELLERADIVIYAGSLVNPALLEACGKDCAIYDSAGMTLEEVLDIMRQGAAEGRFVVRLHTGDPSLYGAIREQIDALRAQDIACEVVPGVSSFAATAAALGAEYTLPGISQSLIITRAAGRTPVPARESLKSFAAHNTSIVLFLSSGMIARACGELVEGGYAPETPAVIVYKASWPEQRIVRGNLRTLPELAARGGIEKTALILVGHFLGDDYERSKLYDPSFTHGFRAAGEPAAVPPKTGNIERNPARAKEKQGIVYAAFSAAGLKTAQMLQAQTGGVVHAPSRFVRAESDILRAINVPLNEWTAAHFGSAEALVFVSAAGIAVRAIAPLLESKTSDPAVVCLDDGGRCAIPILSGHLGGANDLAVRIAAITGGLPIITTATDLHDIPAADSWARSQNMRVENPEAIRSISGAMLEGAAVGVAVTEKTVSPPWPVTLWLRPKNLVLGVGCKKDTPLPDLEAAIADFLEGAGVSPLSVAALASIDLKSAEPAPIKWSEERALPFLTYTAAELNTLEGDFSASERVMETTGTDNVCERAAIRAACALSCDRRAALLRSKTKYAGITLALAGIRGAIDDGPK